MIILIQAHLLKSQAPIAFSSNQKQSLNIWPSCYILEDKNNSLRVDDLIKDSLNYLFNSTKGLSPTFGFTSSSYWLKFKVRSINSGHAFFLTLERVSLWEADLFTANTKGEIKVEHLGVNTPFAKRPFESKFSVCELQPHGTQTYYLKVRAITSLFIPIYLESSQSLASKLSKIDLFNGLYVGTFILIILYNLSALFIRKQRIYSWYLFYVICLFIYQGLFNTGLGFQYLWPNWPGINKYYVVASSMVGISMIAFSAAFLETKENLNKFHPPLFILSAGFLFLMVLSLSGYHLSSNKYFIWVLTPTFIYVVTIAIISMRKGNTNGRFYLAGWGVLLIFYFIFTLWLNGFMGDSIIGHRALFLGSFFEMIFWFTAVSDKVNLSRKTRDEQQKGLRKEVARDFHDELGNQAARMINYVGLLRIRGNIGQEIYETLSLHAQNILDGAKDFVWALDPINDNLNNVIIHLKDFGEHLLSEKNMFFRFYKLGDLNVNLPYGHSRQINLIFREAITNAFKHSNAAAVEMRVEIEKNSAVIILKDNGNGTDHKIIQASKRGIENIRIRSQKIGATVEIISSKNGTSLYLTIQTL